jgi:DNA polymerase III subunit epsilon
MREIAFDTETTGFDPHKGHRIVEIGALELEDHLPTGRTFHAYINPERDVPEEVVKIHGLTGAFLKDKPTFKQICPDFMEFIKGATLIAHNASFDMNFINHHIKEQGHPPIPDNMVIDTVLIARKKFPGASNSLDALCSRFGIDNSHRTLHGALLDSELLAEVYLELKGGRQKTLTLANDTPKPKAQQTIEIISHTSSIIHAVKITPDERIEHAHYLQSFKSNLWH